MHGTQYNILVAKTEDLKSMKVKSSKGKKRSKKKGDNLFSKVKSNQISNLLFL